MDCGSFRQALNVTAAALIKPSMHFTSTHSASRLHSYERACHLGVIRALNSVSCTIVSEAVCEASGTSDPM